MRRFAANLAVAFAAVVAFGALATTASAQTRLVCRGEEPFWTLFIDGGAAALRTLDGEAKTTGTLEDLSWAPPGWLVWRSAESQALRLTAVLRREECFSTMADGPPSPFRAVLLRHGERAALGCCSVDGR